jgi:DNA modification methylase
MLGRNYIGIDISEEYCDIARARLKAVDTGVPVKEARVGQMALFATEISETSREGIPADGR